MTRKSCAPFLSFLCAMLVGVSGCVSRTAVQNAIDKSTTLAPPVSPRRAGDAVLQDFAKQLGSYVTAATGESPIPIEIDYIANDSGIDKELPTDLGQYARNAIERIGRPLQTYRTWPAISLIPRPSGNTLPLLPNERPKPPQASYRLVGSLLRASERVTSGRDARTDAMFGSGHGQTDASLSGEHRRTITTLTVSLTLEAPNGLAVSSAEYRIYVERSELNRSLSVYVAGSGIGTGTRVTVTQDWGDALFDAVAVSVVHLLGNALLVPYYRCGALFAGDSALDDRVRDALSRLTRAELEQTVKRYLFLDGFFMDMRGPDLTDADRAVVVLELRRRSLNFDNRDHMVTFAMDLWRNVDYHKAAERVAERMTASVYAQREQLSAQARQNAEVAAVVATVGPAEFGWPPFVHFVVLDLSRVKEAATRDQIVAAARSCAGCYDVRAHPNKMLVGVRVSSQPSEIQRALKATPLRLLYEFANGPSPRIVVVPAT